MNPTVRINYRVVLSSGETVFELASARRPELALKYTRAPRLSIDERLFSPSFPVVSAPSELAAVILIAGVLDVEGISPLHAGEAILLDRAALGRSRLKNSVFLEAWRRVGRMSAAEVL